MNVYFALTARHFNSDRDLILVTTIDSKANAKGVTSAICACIEENLFQKITLTFSFFHFSLNHNFSCLMYVNISGSFTETGVVFFVCWCSFYQVEKFYACDSSH